jgi:hypothetical protein
VLPAARLEASLPAAETEASRLITAAVAVISLAEIGTPQASKARLQKASRIVADSWP